MYSNIEMVKENVPRKPPVAGWQLAAAVLVVCASYFAITLIDQDMPEPLTRAAPKNHFIAEIAMEHLVNLSSIGPRVAGSYANEVLGVGVALQALRRIAADAAPHAALHIDVFEASGAFALSFLDGLNNVYRGVRGVVARLGARGERGGGAGRALLLNCHLDSVADSPGASDDAAGCAVLLETLRALSAARSPPRRPVLALLNAAEENVLQGAHAFLSRHRWARQAGAVLNVEACGSGGREVLFQVAGGPVLRAYARGAPRPFASSLAQELFESGAVPADTDFRLFRDLAGLSGADLAWSANGYVYHTALDQAARVPRAALQRTGDNVLGLARALLEAPDEPPAAPAAPPLFFDVLGRFVVVLDTAWALLAALLSAGAALLAVALNARDARRRWLGGWARLCLRLWLPPLAALAAGAGAGGVLVLLRAPLAFFARPWLLAPLLLSPACAAWLAASGRLAGRGRWPGWWLAQAQLDSQLLGSALLLALLSLLGRRSGFVFALSCALPALPPLLHRALRPGPPGRTRVLLGCLGAWLCSLQHGYLAHAALLMLVPLLGRAGPDPLVTVGVGAVASGLGLGVLAPLLPLAAVAPPEKPVALCLAAWALALLLASCTPLGFPYSEARPLRLMLFHTRRTLPGANSSEAFFWIPDLDPNLPHVLDAHIPQMRRARSAGGECARWLYCGAPYPLPALSLVPSGHWLPAEEPPAVRLAVRASSERLNASTRLLSLSLAGPPHVVLVVSPVRGARLSWSNVLPRLQEGPPWRGRRTYFFSLFSGPWAGSRDGSGPGPVEGGGWDRPPPQRWELQLHLQHSLGDEGGAGGEGREWARLSVAGHALWGEHKESGLARRLRLSAPAFAAVASSAADLHLLTL